VTRTFEANPYIIEMTFPSQRELNGLSLNVGDTQVKVLAKVYSEEGAEPEVYELELEGSVSHPEVSLNFARPLPVKVLYLEVTDLRQSEPAHVHIWEMYLR
jgi:hypothetical protein